MYHFVIMLPVLKLWYWHQYYRNSLFFVNQKIQMFWLLCCSLHQIIHNTTTSLCSQNISIILRVNKQFAASNDTRTCTCILLPILLLLNTSQQRTSLCKYCIDSSSIKPPTCFIGTWVDPDPAHLGSSLILKNLHDFVMISTTKHLVYASSTH